jgi:replicative DNA helicase
MTIASAGKVWLDKFYRVKGEPTIGETVFGYICNGNSDVFHLFSRDDFFEPNELRLYDKLKEVHDKNNKVEFSEEFIALVMKGDPYWTAERIFNVVATSFTAQNIQALKALLRKAKQNYVAITTSVNIVRSLIEAEETPEVVINDAIEKLNTAVTLSAAKSRQYSMSDLIAETVDWLEARASGKGSVILKTGWKNIDSKLIIQKSDLIIIGGRPSMGKTSVVLQMMLSMLRANEGVKGLLISLEQGTIQITFKLNASFSRVSVMRQRQFGDCSDDEQDAIHRAFSELYRLGEGRLLTMSGTLNIENLTKEIRTAKATLGGLDFVVIDYLGRIQHKAKDQYMRITQISEKLKEACLEENVAILCLSQLSRKAGAEKREPELTDLRDSGAIEQDADAVLFIHRDNYYDVNAQSSRTKIVVKKNRHGEIGQFSEEFNYDPISGHMEPFERGYDE